MTTPTVVLVSGDDVARLVIRRTLVADGLVVVGEASRLDEAEAVVATVQPAVVVLDATLATLDDVDVAAWLRLAAPATRVVLVSVAGPGTAGVVSTAVDAVVEAAAFASLPSVVARAAAR